MAVILGANHVQAAEGAASNYFPGAYGDFFVAVAPDPGPVFVDLNLFYSADVSTTVLQGAINANLDTYAYYNVHRHCPVSGGFVRSSVSASIRTYFRRGL